MGLSVRRGFGKMEEHYRVHMCVCCCSGEGQVAAKPNVPHLLQPRSPPSPQHLEPGIIQTFPELFRGNNPQRTECDVVMRAR